jgi:hypothetical protein
VTARARADHGEQVGPAAPATHRFHRSQHPITGRKDPHHVSHLAERGRRV